MIQLVTHLANKAPHRFVTLSLLFSAFAISPFFIASAEEPVDNADSKVNQTKTSDKTVFGRYVPEREGDFAWENEKVAFRVYGPLSKAEGSASGVDAWFKRVSYPIINKWYAEHLAGKSYHEDQGEGYDVYHTGVSRGIGGTAIWLDNKPYSAGPFSSWKIIENNNDKIRFELEYDFSTPLGSVKEVKEILLESNSNLYRVRSKFLVDGKVKSLPIAIGLSTLDEKIEVHGDESSSSISTWGSLDSNKFGTGAILAKRFTGKVRHEKKKQADASHIWLITSTDDQGEIEFYAGFSWAERGQIKSWRQWKNYLVNSPK